MDTAGWNIETSTPEKRWYQKLVWRLFHAPVQEVVLPRDVLLRKANCIAQVPESVIKVLYRAKTRQMSVRPMC